jgi:hypothetical protein
MGFIPGDMISMSKYDLNFAWIVGLILLIPVPLLSHAGLSLGLTLDRLSASGWVMDDMKVHLNLNSAQQMILNLTATSFRHDALPGGFDEIRLECPVKLIQQRYRCSNGRLRVSNSPYGPQDLKVSGEFVNSEQIKLTTEGFKLAGGRIDINLEMNDGRWEIALEGSGISLDPLRRQFAATLLPDGTALSGTATLAARINGRQDTPSGVDLTLMADNFAYADTEGLHVAEDGQFTLRLDARRKGSEWRGDLQLSMGQGQLYVDPYFIEVVNEPLSAQLTGRWSAATERLHIDQGEVVIPQVLESRGKLEVNLSTAEVVEADVGLNSENVDALYRLFLQPMLIGSMADDLAANGALQTRIAVKNGELLSLRVILDEVDLDDRRGLFALYGLNGRLVWRGEDHPDRSSLSAQGGQLYRIDFGPFSIHAHAQRGEVILEQPVELSVMQGNLLVDRFRAQGLLADTPSWTTKAQLKDISLKALAEAFEWPPMEGNLNGIIPNVHYQQKRLEMEGQLVVDVFGGRIRVDDLLIEEPLGRVPELFADLQLEGLDFGQITQTFSFGHIQGGLEGEVSGLHLASWEPIAFEARFKTPDKDNTPHRISQRAVDNLTALGNGVGSGLSSTFLGIFKEFLYDRIELGAKLNGNVAELDGMTHPDGGYYIVKGSGLPRIDVIARNRKVAWKTLLKRLKRIRVEGMEVR